jgi:predicted metal-dependent hydrolase
MAYQPNDTTMQYLNGYPPDTVQQVERMRDQGQLGTWLLRKYPNGHDLRSDKALFGYLQSLRQTYLQNAAQLSKAVYDSKLQTVGNALGTHARIGRVQGAQLKSRREIRIASVFKQAPLPFLRMISVHELAHFRERDHDRAFYQLCCHMEPQYHQLEFEVRVYLTYLDDSGKALWET